MSGQETQKDPEGRAAVRALLIARASDAGLRRPKNQTDAAWLAATDLLAEHLAYLSHANLLTLAECVINHAAAAGPQQGCWPSEVLIRAWAHALQPVPFRNHRIVWSWLASIEGPVAEAGGYLVELYRFLRRSPRPPLPMDMRLIREQAAENARRITMIRDRARRGVEIEAERVWLEAYATDRRAAQAHIDEGAARRAAGARPDAPPPPVQAGRPCVAGA